MVEEKVAVVILNYKVRDLVLNCINSVKKSSWKDLEIVVVDNDSQDGIEEKVRTISDVTFVQTGKNLGYSGGNNRGIEEAIKNSADYILILNPDTEISPSSIENLVKAVRSDEVGIAAPKILFGDKKTIWYAGGNLDIFNVLGSHRGVDEEDRGQYDKQEETDNATGGAILVKKEVFDRIGLFDERYFLYYEDSDFSFRAKRAGFKIVYVPEAVVYHRNAQSTGLGSPLQDYYITRNRMLFASKFLPIRTRLALIREALGNIRIEARRKALVDFLLGRFGKGGI